MIFFTVIVCTNPSIYPCYHHYLIFHYYNGYVYGYHYYVRVIDYYDDHVCDRDHDHDHDPDHVHVHDHDDDGFYYDLYGFDYCVHVHVLVHDLGFFLDDQVDLDDYDHVHDFYYVDYLNDLFHVLHDVHGKNSYCKRINYCNFLMKITHTFHLDLHHRFENHLKILLNDYRPIHLLIFLAAIL